MPRPGAAALIVCLLIAAPRLGAVDEPVGPITLREDRVPGGWYLHRRMHGTLEEMGGAFARFAVLRSVWGKEGDLVAVLLEDDPRPPLFDVEVGLLMDEEPQRRPGSYLLRTMRPALAAVGEASGSWGTAVQRAREVRAWAEVVGLEPVGPVRLVFHGEPGEPGSLAWQVQLPVREPSPPQTAPAEIPKEPGSEARSGETEKP